LHFNCLARVEGCSARIVLLFPDGEQIRYAVQLNFKATNNMAEYEVLIFELAIALSLGIRELLVKGDSQLIIKQVWDDCNYNDP
jgi:ribonuclease HI